MSETGIQEDIRLAVSRGDTRVFRNNVGSWINRSTNRRISYGLRVGSSDLIGWHSVVVTPDMVGRRVAVFTSIEVKTPKGYRSPQQRRWLDQVKAAGGISGVARSPADALALISSWLEQP